MKHATKKRLRKGVDYHGWAFKVGKGEDGFRPGTLFYWAEPHRPRTKPVPNGKWVRVKFVEARP